MNMMKISVAIAIAAISINAIAQPAATPATAASTTPAAPAAAPVVTAEQKAAVADMLDAINFKQMMSQMLS